MRGVNVSRWVSIRWNKKNMSTLGWADLRTSCLWCRDQRASDEVWVVSRWGRRRAPTTDIDHELSEDTWSTSETNCTSTHTVTCTQWTIKTWHFIFDYNFGNRFFLQFLYHFNREEILHATILKFVTSHRFMCAPYLEKSKPTFLSWFLKHSSVHVTAILSNLNRFQ